MVEEDVDAALARLVTAGTLSAEQAEAVRREVDGPAAAARPRRGIGPVLAEIGGYVGAAFVLAGVAVFTGSHWDDLDRWAQVLVLAGPAALLLAAAVLIRRTAGDAEVPARLVSVLLLLTGGLVGGVTSVLLPGDGSYEGGWGDTAPWAAVTAVWALGYRAGRGRLLHLATLVGTATTAVLLAEQLFSAHDPERWRFDDYVHGLTLLLVAAGWGLLSWFGGLRERAFGLTLAGVTAFVAGEYLSFGTDDGAWTGYLVLALVAALGLAGYLRTRIVGLLVVGVVSLAAVVPEATFHYTDGALSTAGALLVSGLSIVGASALGLRLRREVAARD